MWVSDVVVYLEIYTSSRHITGDDSSRLGGDLRNLKLLEPNVLMVKTLEPNVLMVRLLEPNVLMVRLLEPNVLKHDIIDQSISRLGEDLQNLKLLEQVSTSTVLLLYVTK